MRVLGESVKARYLEQLGRAAPPPDARGRREPPGPRAIGGLPVVFPRDGYQGDYIGEIAADLVRARRRRARGRARRGRLPRGGRAADLRRDPQDARRARHRLRRLLERDGALRGGQARGDARRPAHARIWSTRARARSGCAPPRSGSSATACWSRAAASRPICCPTSPTTARSSAAASTASSTCRAPTTSSSSPSCARRSARSAVRSSGSSW